MKCYQNIISSSLLIKKIIGGWDTRYVCFPCVKEDKTLSQIRASIREFWTQTTSLEFQIMSFYTFSGIKNSLLQSHISYGLILWGHSPSVKNILLIQKKIIRTFCRANYLDHCRPLFIQTKNSNHHKSIHFLSSGLY
jgi:hypothetical protein